MTCCGSVFAAALSLMVMGCASSVSSRIQEKSEVFVALPAEYQIKVRQGMVDEGFTPDMVYMALGKPSRVVGGKWIYRNYFPPSQGPYLEGQNPPGVGSVSDPNSGLAPASGEMAVSHSPTVEILFSGGRVSAINVLP
jgi:hypothetical protein